MALSPTGEFVAIEVTRPLRSPGRYGGWSRPALQPRGEIWLFSGDLQKSQRLDLGGLWAWSPTFSPDGSHLAALTSVGDGKVGFAVWKVPNLGVTHFINLNVDIYSKFSSGGSFESRPQSTFEAVRQFVWLDNSTLMFVDYGADRQQFDFAIGSAADTYSELRAQTANGQISLRSWSIAPQLCGAARSLVRLSIRTGNQGQVYVGNIRGVSISPNSRYLGALVATGRAQFVGQTITAPLAQTTIGDDPAVEVSCVVIDLYSGIAKSVGKIKSVGGVAPRRLPVWADDDSRFAMPTRSRFTSQPLAGTDAVSEYFVQSGDTEVWPARSALDAELISAIAVSGERADVRRRIESRPVIKGRSTTLGQIQGGVWKCLNSRVVLWDGSRVTVLGPKWSESIEGEFTTIFAPVACADGSVALAGMDGDGNIALINVLNATHRVHYSNPVESSVFLGVSPSTKAMYFKRDADDGTYLLRAAFDGRDVSSRLTFNGFLAEVTKPLRRELRLRGSDLKGELFLPTNSTLQHTRAPVIVWAYPDHLPTASDWVGELNSPATTVYPFQYLLARGFAVFHAPFPTSPHLNDLLRGAATAVLRWLDVLNGQPEIAAGEFGFYGHSYAGVVALALEAYSTRIKAIVAYGTFPDLPYAALTAAGDIATLSCAADVIQSNRFYFEDPTQPYSFKRPPWLDWTDWQRDSPLFHLEHSKIPLLLLEGELDASPRSMEAIYSVLHGRGVPVELDLYWDEGHVISSAANLLDSWVRTESFFRKYLRAS